MFSNLKKYTLTKKGWIILSIISVSLITILLYSIFNKEKEIVFENIIIEQTTSEKLSDAFRNKEITTDEYVLYSAYSLYDAEKLDKKYKSDAEYNMAPDLYTLVKNYEDEISEETKAYINDKIQLKNVIIGPENNETSYNGSNVVPMSNYIASSSDVEHRLDKYILSPNSKVVVWYTTKDGVDKITDEQAKEIADNVETYINKYSSEYGIEFKWEKSYLNYYTEEKYKELLKKINSNDVDKLFNAMPIYVSASSNSLEEDKDKTLAYYMSFEPNKNYLNQGENDKYNSLTGIPVGPYINITSTFIEDIESLKSIVAHELFHHYQNYICGEGSYLFCENSISGDELFVQETTANWAAAKVTSNPKLFGMYINSYLGNYYNTIDTLNPYTSMSFLMNYENIVENGKQKILNSLIKSNTNGETLKYLYEQANGKISEVMNALSKNNLINNYQYESFAGYKEANFVFISKCTNKNESGECTKANRNSITNTSGSISPIAMEYFSAFKNNKKYKISNISNSTSSYVNIFSLSKLKEFDFDGKKTQTFSNQKVVYSKKFTNDIIIDLSKIEGEYVAISITNGHLTDDMKYKIEETTENQNIEINNNGITDDNENKNDTTNEKQVYNIYVDNNDNPIEIKNFALNNRAYLDIKEFCSTTKICKASYIDDNKIKVTRTLKINDTNYEYFLINKKQTSEFNSTLVAGNVNFDLKQLNNSESSCPEGKDARGNEMPKCDESAFYVPIRFVMQALGYDVEWNEKDRRIDINSELQAKLIKDNNIKTILSKDKIDIGNTVTNIIELDDEITLEKNTKYYAYSIDKDNKRIFNSGIALIKGDEENFKIINNLDSENKKTTYSSIETSDQKDSATISIVTTITISSDINEHKAGIYPIIKELKITIK